MTGKATLSTTDSNTPQTDNGTSVLHGVREFVATHHDVSTLVRDAQKFSINLPLIGKVSVPTPRQLAVYGVIGALGATGAIEWPVALALGLGVAVAGRELGGRPPAPAQRAALRLIGLGPSTTPRGDLARALESVPDGAG